MRTMLAAALFAAVPLVSAQASPIEILKGSAPGGSPQVKIEATQFSEPEVKVKAGQAVMWVNVDGTAHNVHFRGGPARGHPDAQGRMLNEGDVYVVRFNEAGSYEYIDTLHSTMKARVVVE